MGMGPPPGPRSMPAQVMQAFDVRGGGPMVAARALSGGNMQKLILGRALMQPDSDAIDYGIKEATTPPRLIVAHQPTWGLDIGAVAYVQQQLIAARDAGAAVLLISDDLDEVLTLGDRVAVMHAGHMTPAKPALDWSAKPSAWPWRAWRPTHEAGKTHTHVFPPPSCWPHWALWPSRCCVSALLVLWAGAPVAQTYGLLLKGGFGSVFALSETLTRAIPLILTGLAAAVAFKARLFNIGAEGQLYAGALAAVAVGGLHGGTGFDLPPGCCLLMMLAAALAGALLLLGPALMKARLGVDEVVTTLLLNFIVLLLVGPCSTAR
jgi:energy-coupling factor transporter ATP-binding protein EcfA2